MYLYTDKCLRFIITYIEVLQKGNIAGEPNTVKHQELDSVLLMSVNHPCGVS